MKKLLLLMLTVSVIFGGAFFVFYKNKTNVIREPIPSAQVYVSSISTISPQATSKTSPSSILNSKSEIPNSINLAVPFTVQAPNANWDEIHQEFCEEASILMAVSYIKGWDIPNAEMANQKMFEIKDFEDQRFGYYKDTTAEETAIIVKEFYGIEKVDVIYDPTIQNIKKALSEKKVVLAPAAGQQLGNPYFTSPGPLYHMLVIKGYTKEGNFITNDPGTRRGADFIYNPDVLINAIHDWNGGDVINGKRVVLIVG